MKSIVFLMLAMILAGSVSRALAGGRSGDADLPNFDQVTSRLYRGGQPTDNGLKKLAARGITTIIDLRQDDKHARQEKAVAESLGLKFYVVPMSNIDRPRDEEIARVLELIDNPASGMVFVHCLRGADRTGAVIAIYRVARQGWTADEAIREAGKYSMRWWQFGKRDYIRDYEKRARARSSQRDSDPGSSSDRQFLPDRDFYRTRKHLGAVRPEGLNMGRA